MSDLANLHVVQNLFESVGTTLDICDILKDRDLARRYSDNRLRNADSLHTLGEGPTARTAVRKAVEDTFILAPRPAKAPMISGYHVEQEYEGTVVAIDERNGTFTARLTDITGGGPDEEGEFSLGELNGDDAFVVPGAVFTWSIGVQIRGPRGRQQRGADLRFRRIAPISLDSIATAKREAKELSAFLIDTESDALFTNR